MKKARKYDAGHYCLSIAMNWLEQDKKNTILSDSMLKMMITLGDHKL